MQSGANGHGEAAQQERLSSVPPTTSVKATRTLGASSLQRATPTKASSVSTNPFSVPSSDAADNDAELEDFGAAWGDDIEDAESSTADDAFVTKASAAAPLVNYDDGGEPDFAGWLTAQSQAKQKPKIPLPKGLTKSAKPNAIRPIVGDRHNTTGHVATKKLSSLPYKTAPVVAPKKVEQKPEVEDEGWGDAWD
jgi:SCY1-like protein 1